jgi:hypothetical protein
VSGTGESDRYDKFSAFGWGRSVVGGQCLRLVIIDATTPWYGGGGGGGAIKLLV